MEAVVKVGGSLAEDPTGLKRLCQELSVLAEEYKILIVPGGGTFADTVRKIDKFYGLSNNAAHKMAILAMDQYALFLLDITPNSIACYALDEVGNSAKEKMPIFLPSQHMFREDPLEHSWDVTSDTITAYIADKLAAKNLILVTDVDGIFSEDPQKSQDSKLIQEVSAEELQEWKKRTSVDKSLPKTLLQSHRDCYVVNGRYPERIRLILENKKTVCTHITV
ncbi:MAG: hypothetical protein JW815_01395 [Candidatus Bathyarchaeota archaeon]|nr:hypothetical protein [Candidatus Bathyarchaeum sp.]